jgi:hypothetical protein
MKTKNSLQTGGFKVKFGMIDSMCELRWFCIQYIIASQSWYDWMNIVDYE